MRKNIRYEKKVHVKIHELLAPNFDSKLTKETPGLEEEQITSNGKIHEFSTDKNPESGGQNAQTVDI